MSNKVMLIKTDKCCYVSDCFSKKRDDYNYSYHRSIIPDLFFDGEKAKETWGKHWYRINKYPDKVEIGVNPEKINRRYEIKDIENITKKLPQIIFDKEIKNYDSDILDNLYEFKYEMSEPSKKDYCLDIEVVCEVDNFTEPCRISYKTTNRINWEDRIYTITNADVKRSLFDQIILPDVLLTNKPCEFTSKQMYDITRQYVKDNIDNKMAIITSDYDFCFTVQKIVPLLEPKEISYSHIFARTKREREKIHYKTATTKKFDIFSMTHNQENYREYTAIEGMFANSETELKQKVDLWLETLIGIINKPMHQCLHCNGSGYFEEPERISKNAIIDKINNENDEG